MAKLTKAAGLKREGTLSKVGQYESRRRSEHHYTRIPNEVWKRIERRRKKDWDLATLRLSMSQVIELLLAEACERRERSEKKNKSRTG